MRVGFIFRRSDRTETQGLEVLINADAAGLEEAGQIAFWREIDFPVVVLVPTLAPHIGYAQDRLVHQCLLNANAVLVARRRLVIKSDPGYADGKHRQIPRANDAARPGLEARVGEGDIVQCGAGIERSVRRPVVHVIALDAVIHHAKATSHYGFGLPCQVIGETDAWSESGPVVVR